MEKYVTDKGVEITNTRQGAIVCLDDRNIKECLQELNKQRVKRLSIFTSEIGKSSYNLDNLDFFNHGRILPQSRISSP